MLLAAGVEAYDLCDTAYTTSSANAAAISALLDASDSAS